MQLYAEVAGLPRRLVVPVPVLTPAPVVAVGRPGHAAAGGAGPAADRRPEQRGRGAGPARHRRAARTSPSRSGTPSSWPSGGSSTSTWPRGGAAPRSPAAAVARRSRARPIRTGPAAPCCRTRSGGRRPAPPAAVFAVISGVGGRRGLVRVGLAVGGARPARPGGGRHRAAPGAPPPRRAAGGRRPRLLAGRRLRAAARCCACGPRCASPGGRGWSGASAPTTTAAPCSSSGPSSIPAGLWGRLYWYSLLPFHAVIFGRLTAKLVAAAEARPLGPVPG